MDNATLAAFRASGETDINKFLQKQAVTADTPPGVPGGYAAGNAAFQGATNAEQGIRPAPPTGAAFLDRIRSGLSALSGIPNQIRTALTGSAPVAPAPASNLFAASRTGALEGDLDALQQRSTQLAQPVYAGTRSYNPGIASTRNSGVLAGTTIPAILASREALEKEKQRKALLGQ